MNGKTLFPRKFVLTAILALSAASLMTLGCSKEKTDELSDQAADMYVDAKIAVNDGWQNVKDYTFEKKADFARRGQAIASDMDARISKLQADYADSKADAAREAAMEKLQDARVDFDAKLDALGSATVATWVSAKQNVIASWEHLEAAIDEAQAGD